MITKSQIEQLAKDYQIDSFTIFREYLQLVFLTYLYQQKEANKIYFKGGTAIHLLLGSPRFSEDLDFSTEYHRRQIKEIIKKVEEAIEKELPGIKIFLLYQGKNSIGFRLKYQHPDFKYPSAFRIDFNKDKKPQKIVTSPLITRFPLVFFPIVSHLSYEEILAEKIRAFLKRGKGRDVFDLWFLLEKGVKLDEGLVKRKLKKIKKEFNKEKLAKKIKNFPLKKLQLDLNKFLPRPQRKIIKILRERLIVRIKN